MLIRLQEMNLNSDVIITTTRNGKVIVRSIDDNKHLGTIEVRAGVVVFISKEVLMIREEVEDILKVMKSYE